MQYNASARVVKYLWGDGTTFHADVKRDGHCTCKGIVYADMFYGGMVLFSGGMPSPSTRVLSNALALSICGSLLKRVLCTKVNAVFFGSAHMFKFWLMAMSVGS